MPPDVRFLDDGDPDTESWHAQRAFDEWEGRLDEADERSAMTDDLQEALRRVRTLDEGDESDGIAVRLCRVDVCEEPALDRAGIYAGLCSEHKEAAREERRSKAGSGIATAVKATLNEPPPVIRRPAYDVDESTSFDGQLVHAARRVEEARLVYEAALNDLRELVAELP